MPVANHVVQTPSSEGPPVSSGTCFRDGEMAKYGVELYKLYVSTADKVSERRAQANSLFLTLNSALIALLGVTPSAWSLQTWRWIVPMTGILATVSWFVILRSYKALNSAKFRVILELEKELPAAPFTKEWEIAVTGSHPTYRRLTAVESLLPMLYGVVYLALLALVCS